VHDYVDVKQTAANLEEMLKLAGGKRQVPVIVKGTEVTIGFGGT
jgi:glutaredoxin